ncbi:hypothetical protein SLS62_006507 [Diatrype stigma]|uniref:Uncharacterized protein n=1 Tax=Diatrype stigma TaxID=117547 RepID=A0AAN9URB6_9PEZI
MGNILGVLRNTLHITVEAAHMMIGDRVRSWNPAREIPPGALAGKIVLITGGTVGIGRQAAVDLASQPGNQPAEIWIASRNAALGREVVAEVERAAAEARQRHKLSRRRRSGNKNDEDEDDEDDDEEEEEPLRARFVPLDLASFASVHEAARTVAAAVPRLDILILNSGLMGGPVSATTEDGYELRFGLNYVGHVLLAKLLLPLMLRSSEGQEQEGDGQGHGQGPRIVAVSSTAHSYTPAGGIVFDALKGPAAHLERTQRYGQSKLALVLWAREMAERVPQVTTVSIHPGTVRTELFSQPEGGFVYRALKYIFVPLFGLSVADGTKNTLWAATAPAAKKGGRGVGRSGRGAGLINGEYYEPVGVPGLGSRFTTDRGLSKRLWEWTEEELKGQEL